MHGYSAEYPLFLAKNKDVGLVFSPTKLVALFAQQQ
jgi:hypothetical protein